MRTETTWPPDLQPETQECPRCDGNGWLYCDDRGPRSDDWFCGEVACRECEGTGEVEVW